MTEILILALCLVSVCLVMILVRYRKLTKAAGKLEYIEKNLAFLTKNWHDLENIYSETVAKNEKLNQQVSELRYDIEVAENKRNAAHVLAEKELELARERQLNEFNRKLEEEKEKILAESDVTKYKQELAEINKEIEEARQTLKVQQEQALNAAKEEDFINFHSIGFTSQDIKDIELIRDFAPKLTRQEAFFKLIWTEFYQKPIQALCKTLGAEKVTGIYKITNTQNGRMYIGQAIDIASRWKEHCKCGLGIGSTGYMTNKFYKALHDTGIENFTFEVLEICEKTKLSDREFYWIDFYNATTFGYNSKAGG